MLKKVKLIYDDKEETYTKGIFMPIKEFYNGDEIKFELLKVPDKELEVIAESFIKAVTHKLAVTQNKPSEN